MPRWRGRSRRCSGAWTLLRRTSRTPHTTCCRGGRSTPHWPTVADDFARLRPVPACAHGWRRWNRHRVRHDDVSARANVTDLREDSGLADTDTAHHAPGIDRGHGSTVRHPCERSSDERVSGCIEQCRTSLSRLAELDAALQQVYLNARHGNLRWRRNASDANVYRCTLSFRCGDNVGLARALPRDKARWIHRRRRRVG